MRGAPYVAVAAGVLCGAFTPSVARSEGRLQDRFFFGVAGGVALTRADALSVVNTAGGQATPPPSSGAPIPLQAGPLVSFETSFWPLDYIGLGTSIALMGGPSPTTNPSQGEAWTGDLGMFFVLAIPLRYVQPYAGMRGSLRMTTLSGQVSPVLPGVQPVAGVNVYVTRNLRAFVQWQYAGLDWDAAGGAAQVHVGGASAQLLSSGLRWSPDFFHAARPAMKFDLVWWSMLFSVAAWGAAAWLGSSH